MRIRRFITDLPERARGIDTRVDVPLNQMRQHKIAQIVKTLLADGLDARAPDIRIGSRGNQLSAKALEIARIDRENLLQRSKGEQRSNRMIAAERDDVPLRAEHTQREHADMLHLRRRAAAIDLRDHIRRVAFELQRADELDHQRNRFFVHAVEQLLEVFAVPFAARFLLQLLKRCAG